MKAPRKHLSPPWWATRLLEWYCTPHLFEEIAGDLQEEFDYQVKKTGPLKARLDYIQNVLGFVRPFAIKRKKSTSSNHALSMEMLKHYAVIAMRNALRQKTFSLINIAGLALGMTCCLFIFLWVQDERQVDNFHVNGPQLFDIYQTVTKNGQPNGSYNTPPVLIFEDENVNRDKAEPLTLEDIRQVIPEIQKWNMYATGYELPWGHPETLQVGEKLQKFNGARAGKDFFTMFSYPVIAGNSATALQDISSIAISRQVAEYFFDDPAQAVGKSIRYENKFDFVINAVFENVSEQSSLQFDFLVNWDSQIKQLEWASSITLTTLQLDPSADVNQVEAKLNRFLQLRLPQNKPEKITLGLSAYKDKYLNSRFVNGKPAEGRIVYVRIFTGIAIFILIIACINFMNLATARSIKRAKEVGVRKVVGSSRFSLIGQFFGESILLSFLSLVVSALLVELLLPAFNTLTARQIVSPVGTLEYWLGLITLAIGTGLVAGSYPALYLSSLKPVLTLKGAARFTTSAIWFRKGLVLFQFALSIALIIVTIVVSNQAHFLQHTNLGYDRNNLVYVQLEGDLNPKYELFKERALSMPGIAMVDRSTEAPHAMGFIVDENDGLSNTQTGDDAINWEGKEKNASVGFKPASVGFDFVRIMKLQIAEGRDFSKSFATDSADAFMINEEAVKQMGLKDPIGKWISAWNKKGHIIGILKDYHTSSLREPIRPLVIDVKEYEYFGVIIVRLEQGKTAQGLASLKTLCQELNPNYSFAFQFMDQEYNRLYNNEQVITRLTNIFAVLGIVISCLGLLGLVMFAGEQRTREIGIRKVLGASVADIVNLLSKEFVVLVVLSFLIAAPVAGYFVYQWLQGFAYKIELSWWIFAVSGASVLVIALFTISLQATQSAVVNPIKSLKVE